jgi:chromate reductase
MSTKPKIVAISGSIRKGSFNTAILETLAAEIADRATVEILPLNDIPLYDQDLDNATPPAAVATLRAKIGAADGVIILSPEYNYGVSGVLKNALDWASRPYAKSTLIGKPIVTGTSSVAATGGVRAQAQLHETLSAIGARVLLRPQIVIGAAHDKVKDGKLIDKATLSFVVAGADDLLKDIGQTAALGKKAA